ncbi:aspartate/glutamate racemase family protein [Streptomyces sp. SYSU K217416]
MTTIVVLINPNTNADTTAMMAAIARRTLRPEDGFAVRESTVAAGPPMITDEAALRASEDYVLDAADRALQEGEEVAAVVVSAFGDPGVDRLRERLPVPVVGIAEAALAEAAAGGARFGVATTTPDLADAIAARVAGLGLSGQYTGIRLTPGDPRELAGDPDTMRERLAEAVEACIVHDGAQAVIIGGGPLGEAAEALRERFGVPVIGPIPAASRRVRRLLGESPDSAA